MHKTAVNQFGHKYFLMVICIFCISCFVRMFCSQIDYSISRDGAYYINLIRESSNYTEFYEYVKTDKYFWVPPLFIYLIQAIARIFEVSYFVAGVSMNLFFGSLIPVAFFCLSNRIFSELRTTLLTTTVAVFNPKLIYLSYQIQRESIYFLFFLISIVYLVKKNQCCRYGNIFMFGVTAGLATSIRFEGLELLLFLFVSNIILRKQGFSSVIAEQIICMLSFLITLIVVSFLIFGNFDALYIHYEHYRKFFFTQ